MISKIITRRGNVNSAYTSSYDCRATLLTRTGKSVNLTIVSALSINVSVGSRLLLTDLTINIRGRTISLTPRNV